MKYLHRLCDQVALTLDHDATLSNGNFVPSQVTVNGVQPAVDSPAICGSCGLPLALGGVFPYDGIHREPFARAPESGEF